MSGPVAVKTWKAWPIRVDGLDPSDTSLSRAMARKKIWLIKEALIGAPGAWTVVSSCGYNGSIWQAGASDYWTSATRVIWAATYPCSWIVLKNTAISSAGNGFQLCMVCTGSATNVEYMEFYISGSGGFAGGTTGARPTASDELKIKEAASGDVWTNRSDGTLGGEYHVGGVVFKTSDGEHTRIYSTDKHGTENYLFAFEKYESFYPSEAIPEPWFVIKGLPPTYSCLFFGDVDFMGYSTFVNRASGTQLAKLSAIGQGGGPLCVYNRFFLPDVFGKWSCFPVGLVTPYGVALANAAPPYDSMLVGRIKDIWFLPTEYLLPKFTTGDYYPDSASRQFVVMGDFLQPSDGSIVYLG